MANKNKPLGRTLMNLVSLGFALFNVTQKLTRLVGFETHLALDSIITLIILAVTSGIILATIWLSLLALLFIYFLSLQWSILFSLCAILLINVLFLLLCVYVINKKKRKIFFPLTHSQLRILKKHLRNFREEA